jgi:hypothetical protein
MKINILPKTSLGRWSVVLALIFIVILTLAQIPTGFNGFMPGLNPVLLTILFIILIGTSVAAFITGLFSVTKSKERSILVFAGMVISLWLGIIGAVGHFFI